MFQILTSRVVGGGGGEGVKGGDSLYNLFISRNFKFGSLIQIM